MINTKTLSAPLSVCFAITNKCNLNCKHCLASSSRKYSDLSTKKILNIIKQIKDLKIFNVSIFGGEPLMRKDFFTILEALSSLKINLSLNTNATLITKNIAEKLAKYPIKTYTVSLDGASSKIQDSFRGQGSFVKNLKGIKNLIDKKCNILISTTVTKFNYKDLKNIVLLGKKLGVKKVRFNDVMYIGNAWCFHKKIMMSAKEKVETLKTLEDLKKKFGNFITGSVTQVIDIVKEIKNSPKKKFPLKIKSCGAGTVKCAIRPDGWVTPCEILWDVKAGNLKNKNLYNIWHTSNVMKEFRKTIEVKEEEIPECKDCVYLRLCYMGHRCMPYYLPMKDFKYKALYCWKKI